MFGLVLQPFKDRSPIIVDKVVGLEEIASEADGRDHGKTKRRASSKQSSARRVAPRETRKPGAARNRLGQATSVAGVRLTSPGKVLYPEQGLTKRDLADYYERLAEWILPHVVDRPLAVVRCPEGRGKPCFYQKHPSESGPQHLRTVDISEQPPAEFNLVIKDTAGLIELVQMGVLEIHVWGSQVKNLEKPNRLVFDLDPGPGVDWPRIVQAAREVRSVLEELGLTTFLKTTGGKGLHLVVPIQARTEWDEAKAFCKAVADLIVRAAPDRYIATMSKAARKGKIFVDYLRNGRGATSVAAYSTRSKAGAPVSVPISWSELSPQLRSDQFTVQNVFARLDRLKSDPWADLATTRQSITKAMIERVQV